MTGTPELADASVVRLAWYHWRLSAGDRLGGDCPDCLVSEVEVVDQVGELWGRAWHEVTCPTWKNRLPNGYGHEDALALIVDALVVECADA
jgi:hypothetical protein